MHEHAYEGLWSVQAYSVIFTLPVDQLLSALSSLEDLAQSFATMNIMVAISAPLSSVKAATGNSPTLLEYAQAVGDATVLEC